MKKKLQMFFPYITLLFFLTIISVLTRSFFHDQTHLIEEPDFQLFILGSMIFIGYYINRIAPKTIIPSFVWAIFAGMAIQPLLSFYLHNISALKIVMEVFGAIILFAGGLEIPFKNFQKWFIPITSLSFIGVIISSLCFAFFMFILMNALGIFSVALIPSILILSAALSSTDPTAIIPTLKVLRFKRPHLKQIAISESALTDVSGSIFTRFLLLALLAAPSINNNLFSYFLPLVNKPTYDALALQIITGILIGYIGFALIKKFYYKDHNEEGDPALLLSVPIFTFVTGNILGGAGFLASFISGLLTDTIGGIKKVSHFYESILNHLIKPFIFIVCALVPISTLLSLAWVGILAALIFMFVIRPFVVFVSLIPWIYQGVFKLPDLIFLSFIRETGIIAAILLIIAATYDIINSEFVIAIGMWIILLTLILEPPLTPILAKKIGVAEDAK